MTTVLVTGGAGFIGSHTVDALLAEGYRVRILDNLDPQVHGPNASAPDYVNAGAELVIGDVRNRRLIADVIQDVDLVIHDAAAVGVGQSQYAIAHYTSVNVGGTAVLLDVLANEAHQVRKLVVASSMSIYGEGLYHCVTHGRIEPFVRPDAQLEARDWTMRCPECQGPTTPLPTHEGKGLRCTSIYAQSKKDQEEYVHIFGRTYGIPTVAMRYFNVYGPRQSMSNPYTGVAAIFSSRIKNGQAPLVYEDGEQSRDFTSVRDIVAAKLLVLRDHRADFGSFNVGTGRRTSILEIAHTLVELYGASVGVEVTGMYRSGDIRHCFGDVSRLEALGFRPSVSLEAGLEELVRWGLDAAADDRVDDAHSELVQRGLVA
jgi:dTDP-L-rhamnose 4-epimerase